MRERPGRTAALCPHVSASAPYPERSRNDMIEVVYERSEQPRPHYAKNGNIS